MKARQPLQEGRAGKAGPAVGFARTWGTPGPATCAVSPAVAGHAGITTGGSEAHLGGSESPRRRVTGKALKPESPVVASAAPRAERAGIPSGRAGGLRACSCAPHPPASCSLPATPLPGPGPQVIVTLCPPAPRHLQTHRSCVLPCTHSVCHPVPAPAQSPLPQPSALRGRLHGARPTRVSLRGEQC